jgi:hypothetical protein
MWIFTAAADWFDKQRVANYKFLDATFQGWIDYTQQHGDDPGFVSAFWNVSIYCDTGLLYGLNQLTTTVASGFVDTLRIGDGVKKGGWGYAQDALRFLTIAGPAFRVARFGIAKVLSLDPAATSPICSWISANLALKLTGIRHFATIDQIATATGIPAVAAGAGADWAAISQAMDSGAAIIPDLPAVFLEDTQAGLQLFLGADATLAGSAIDATQSVENNLLNILQDNANAVAPFSVKWAWTTAANVTNEFSSVQPGTIIGHTMVAFRSALTGALQIMDRTGRIVGSLAELESAGYSGISNATFYQGVASTIMLVKNSTVVTVLENAVTPALSIQSALTPLRATDGSLVLDPRWIWKFVGLELQSIPFRVETRRAMAVPLRVAPAKGQVKTQTFCMSGLQNSDNPLAPPSCTTTQTYVVQQGDTLQSIAQTAYGDPQRTKGIAAVNSISDPNTIQPGMVLVIP